MGKKYIEKREDGGYWLAGTRISLDVIVTDFNRGDSPETIRRNFPSLTLEEIYGTLTFYLAHQTILDEYLRESGEFFDKRAKEINEEFRRKSPELAKRLESRREVTV